MQTQLNLLHTPKHGLPLMYHSLFRSASFQAHRRLLKIRGSVGDAGTMITGIVPERAVIQQLRV